MRISPVPASNVERSRALCPRAESALRSRRSTSCPWEGRVLPVSRSSPAGRGRTASSRSSKPTAVSCATWASPKSGAMHIAHEDGTEQEIRAGEAYVIEPGHNAWVVGAEPFVGFEFESQSFSHAARRVRRHVLTGVASPEGVKSPPLVAPSADRETSSPCLPSASREARITWARPRCRTHCLRRRPPRHPTPSRMRGGGE